jgi:hypothetical protein
MICKVKTVTTITFVCCECRIPFTAKAGSVIAAEKIAKAMGWTEKPNGQALCADCSREVRNED